MLEGGGKRLKYCRGRAGEKLRSMTTYRSDSTTQMYRREGLREQYSEDRVAELVRSARDPNTTLHRTDIGDAPPGTPVAGVYTFEDAFVIQLPADETSGVVATFDADVGSDLATFIEECQRAFQGG